MTSKLPIISCLALFLFALDCSAQKLGDIARQERARQKRLHSTVVVVSGATTSVAATSSTTAAVATPPSATPPTTPPSATAPTAAVDNKGQRDEKYWRTQFDNARAALKKAQDNVQLLDLKTKDLNTQMLRQSDMYNREYRLGPQIAETQKQLDDANKQVDDAKKKIADLEDELRRAGGPPGWSR
jgi:predicted RNase H-like nuclease (RuvC/YqgF family)